LELAAAAPAAPAEPASPPVPAVEPPKPFSSEDLAGYHLPTLEQLRPPAESERVYVGAEELEASKRQLQDALDSFAIDAFVYDAIVGPRVTQFRVRPGFGVRVESIAALEKNIALAMLANAVRIQAPIPGESFVGVEIPNRHSSPLALRGVFESAAWRGTTAELPLVLGVDIAGQQVLCDLARAPHASRARRAAANRSASAISSSRSSTGFARMNWSWC
jgi:S-DNA-T family DNA segregation ATPase FtsK/SpoIIIE